MLPMAVIVLAGAYLLLHYSGAFDEISKRMNRTGKGRSPARVVEQELDKRLQVFEDFLEQDTERDEEPPSG